MIIVQILGVIVYAIRNALVIIVMKFKVNIVSKELFIDIRIIKCYEQMALEEEASAAATSQHSGILKRGDRLTCKYTTKTSKVALEANQ